MPLTAHRVGALRLVLIAAVLAAYANSFQGAFVLDDLEGVVNNPHIRHLSSFAGPALLRSRGLVDFTFAANFAVGGLSVAHYHAFALLAHVAVALLLFELLRCTFGLSGVATFLRRDAAQTAFFAACLWAVHPLTTSAVTYISQRYEVMMAMFYVLALLAVAKGAGAVGARARMGWYTAAVVSCALGMLCKEVMVTAPILILLYDRLFLSVSLRESLRRRRWLYAGLAVSWGVLAVAMLSGGPATGRVDAALPAGPSLRYALTQAMVILHYLKLAAMPRGLCLDYSWPLVQGIQTVLPELTLMCALLGAVLAGLRFAPRLAFAGLSFFVILAPTSSILPRPDCAFEHRVYLPLAAVAAIAIVLYRGAWQRVVKRVPLRAWRCFVWGPAVAAVLALGVLAHMRNREFADAESMWQGIAAGRTDHFRARSSLIAGAIAAGRYAEAEKEARQLIRHLGVAEKTEGSNGELVKKAAPYHYAIVYNQLGGAQLQQGDGAGAAVSFREALRHQPDHTLARHNLALTLSLGGARGEAIEQLETALLRDDSSVECHSLLAQLLGEEGRYREAVVHYARATVLRPERDEIGIPYAWILSTCRDAGVRNGVAAVRIAGKLAGRMPSDYRVMDVLGAAHAENGDFADAVAAARAALELLASEGWDAGDARYRAIEVRLKLYAEGRPFRMGRPEADEKDDL